MSNKTLDRRSIREHIFKILFCIDFYKPEDISEIIDGYFDIAPEEADKFEEALAFNSSIEAGIRKILKLDKDAKEELEILAPTVFDKKDSELEATDLKKIEKDLKYLDEEENIRKIYVKREDKEDLSLLHSAEFKEEDVYEIKKKVEDIINGLEVIDGFIDANSEGWKVARIAKAEKSILRLAVYEIKYDDMVPDKVAINEAVELAKKYGGLDSSSFVNGILAKLV